MSRVLLCLAVSLACPLLVACREPLAHPPPAPPLDGSTDADISCPTGCPTLFDLGPRDLGRERDASGLDGSADADAGPTGFCEPFPRAGSSVTLPTGFDPTHLVARWNTESCAAPELIVALTEGGCDLTTGERIVLRFSEARVTDGSIMSGLNTIYADVTHPLQVQYVRTDPPSLTVGPCGVGTVVVGELTLTRGGRFSATFDLGLDDCGVVGDTGTSILGTFDVPIVESSADACR